MRKLGCCAERLLGNDILQNLEIIRQVGFDSVFFSWADETDMTPCIEKARSLGLTVECFHAPFGEANSIWLEGKAGDAYVELLRRCIRDAAAYGVPVVVVHASKGVDVPKASPIGLLRFKKLVIEAKRQGVRLALENTEIIRHLGLLLEYFQSDAVGYCYVCGHEKCYTPGFRFMKLFGERTICLHLHDNLGLAASKDVDYRDDLHRIPLDGAIDFARVCRDIKESGFAGTLMLEIADRKPYDFYGDLTPEQFYQRAYAAAEKLRDMTDDTGGTNHESE